jgi:hypothetical protein
MAKDDSVRLQHMVDSAMESGIKETQGYFSFLADR